MNHLLQSQAGGAEQPKARRRKGKIQRMRSMEVTSSRKRHQIEHTNTVPAALGSGATEQVKAGGRKKKGKKKRKLTQKPQLSETTKEARRKGWRGIK